MNCENEVGGLFKVDTDTVYPDIVVKIDKTQYSVFELKRQYEDKNRQNIVLNPDFQRAYVWKKNNNQN